MECLRRVLNKGCRSQWVSLSGAPWVLMGWSNSRSGSVALAVAAAAAAAAAAVMEVPWLKIATPRTCHSPTSALVAAVVLQSWNVQQGAFSENANDRCGV